MLDCNKIYLFYHSQVAFLVRIRLYFTKTKYLLVLNRSFKNTYNCTVICNGVKFEKFVLRCRFAPNVPLNRNKLEMEIDFKKKIVSDLKKH